MKKLKDKVQIRGTFAFLDIFSLSGLLKASWYSLSIFMRSTPRGIWRKVTFYCNWLYWRMQNLRYFSFFDVFYFPFGFQNFEFFLFNLLSNACGRPYMLAMYGKVHYFCLRKSKSKQFHYNMGDLPMTFQGT